MISGRQKVARLAGILLIVLGSLALVLWLAREPREQGRTLSRWLQDLDKPSAATNVQTIAAFRRMGAKAATRLVPMLDASDSALKLRVVELARKQRFVEVRFTPASVRRERATRAFEMMGEHAVAAAPGLVSILVRRGARPAEHLVDDPADRAAGALSHLGSRAIPHVRPALYNEHARVQQAASDVLVLIASYRTREAVAELFHFLDDSNPKVRKAGVYALGKFQSEPNVVIPRLERMLGDANLSVRKQAAFALGRFGSRATASRPALQQACSDGAPEVRRAAERALAEIGGETASSKAAETSDLSDEK